MLKFDDKDHTWLLFAPSLIFAAAKVFGFINWGWLWIFSPMLIALGLFILCYGTAGIVMLVKKHKAKKELRRMCKHD